MAESHRVDVVVSAIDKASAPLKRIGGGFNLLTKQGLMAGAMFAGVTIGMQAAMQGFQKLQQWIDESVDKFRAFTGAMAEVSTMLDTVGMELLPQMTRQIEFMSVAFSKSAIDLSRGLYQVLSAGIDASQAMSVLRASSKLATATLTSVETAVDAVTTVLNAYGMAASQAEHVSNIFAKTIVEGKVRMEELATAIGYVVPIAAQAGIAFEEVAAAIATLSKQGISAQKSARGLRQVITQLISPSEEAISAAIDMGIAFDELVIEGMGLQGVMKMINDATAGSVAEMSRIIPNTQALSAGLALGAQEGNLFANTLHEISSELATLDTMYDKVTQSADFLMKQQQMMSETLDRLVGENMEPFDREMEKSGRLLKRVVLDWTSWLHPITALNNLFKANTVETKIMNEALAETNRLMAEGEVEDYAALYDKLQVEADNAADFIRRVGISTEQLTDVQIPAIKTQMSINDVTHAYQQSLRFMNAALTDARYSTYIHESSTRDLIDTIREYREELERLAAIQREYNRETQVNSLAILRIQLAADDRRGRMTRNEKMRLKEIERANTVLRIKSIENQLEISKMQERLSPAEKELERSKLAYAEQLYIIQDTYAREQEALQNNIDYKNSLLIIYEGMVREHLERLRAIKAEYGEFVDVTLPSERVLSEYLTPYGGHIDPYTQWALSQGKKLQAGTPYVPSTGLYMLHKGEAVTPAAQNRGGMGGRVHVDPMTINVNIYDNADIPHLVQKIELALQGGLLAGLTTGYS